MGGLRHRDPGRGGRRRDHDHRHAAQQRPADDDLAALERQARGARAARRTSTSGSGAAPSRATSPTCAPLHEAGVFGFKCFLLDSGVAEFPPLDRRRLRRGDGRDRPARRAADRARRGRRSSSTQAPAAGRRRATPRSWRRARGGRGRRAIAAVARARAGRAGGRAHVVHLSTADACRMLRGRAAGGRGRLGRDLPALPDLRRRGHPRRRHPVQVLPADPRGGQPRAAVGRPWPPATSTWSSPTTRRAPRDLKRLTPATSGRPGAGSPRCSSACRPCGPGPARGATPSPTWCAGWPAPPTGSDSPTRAGSRSAPTPTWSSSPPTRSSSSTRAPAPPQPGVGLRRPPARPAWYGRPGCAANAVD